MAESGVVCHYTKLDQMWSVLYPRNMIRWWVVLVPRYRTTAGNSCIKIYIFLWIQGIMKWSRHWVQWVCTKIFWCLDVLLPILHVKVFLDLIPCDNLACISIMSSILLHETPYMSSFNKILEYHGTEGLQTPALGRTSLLLNNYASIYESVLATVPCPKVWPLTLAWP